jgi:hypothetical protein
MSREERRQYQRQMKSMERGPALPPAARARAERIAARRARRREKAAPPGTFTRGYVIRSLVIALAAGIVAFSVQWPNMPWALYLGLIVMVVILGLLAGLKLLQRRVTPPAN